MSLSERFARWRDRMLFGDAAADALKQAEDSADAVVRHAAECQRQVDTAWRRADAKVDRAISEMRKTPREKPRAMWPTPPHEHPPAPFTPKGPSHK